VEGFVFLLLKETQGGRNYLLAGLVDGKRRGPVWAGCGKPRVEFVGTALGGEGGGEGASESRGWDVLEGNEFIGNCGNLPAEGGFVEGES